MNVLVTGGTGFIAGHLLDFLVERGSAVRAAHRGPPPLPRSGVEWTRVGDVGPATDWTHAVDGVDAVVHLAAIAHRGGVGEPPPEEYRRVNVGGTRSLAAAAAAAGVRRVVLLSSVAAVASTAAQPIGEATAPQPATAYGCSKLEAEQTLAAVIDGSPTQWCALRPPLVYGPGDPGNMARLHRLARLPLPLGGIDNRRSFLYVGNLVSAVIRCLEHPAAAGRTYLVADRETVSTPDLVRRLAALSGGRARLVRLPQRALGGLGRAGTAAGRVLRRRLPVDVEAVNRLTGSLPVDTAAIERELGWTPPFTLDEGLAATFAAPLR